jgi:hypothetical protein
MSTILYIISKENDDVAIAFGLGIVGELLIFIFLVIRKLLKLKRYYNKRSIIEIEETGERRWCNLKDTEDINGWIKGYKLIKRYATKDEWNLLQSFDKEFILASKRNCDHCIHDRKECHPDGTILCNRELNVFNKFEKIR